MEELFIIIQTMYISNFPKESVNEAIIHNDDDGNLGVYRIDVWWYHPLRMKMSDIQASSKTCFLRPRLFWLSSKIMLKKSFYFHEFEII